MTGCLKWPTRVSPSHRRSPSQSRQEPWWLRQTWRWMVSSLPNAGLLHYIGERSSFLRDWFLSTYVSTGTMCKAQSTVIMKGQPLTLGTYNQSPKSLALWGIKKEFYLESPTNGWVLALKSEVGNTQECAHTSDVKPPPPWFAVWLSGYLKGKGHVSLLTRFSMAAVDDLRNLMPLP